LFYNTKISDNIAESGKVALNACSVSTLNGKGNPLEKEFLWFWIARFRDKSVSDDINEIDGFFVYERQLTIDDTSFVSFYKRKTNVKNINNNINIDSILVIRVI
jgi:hypothetical protein